MTSADTSGFLSAVRRSRLIAESDLAGWMLANESRLPTSDSNGVAETRVCDGLLSEWQASKLLHGKWKGFFLDQYKIVDWHHTDEARERTYYTATCTRTGEKVLLECVPQSHGTRSDGNVRYNVIRE
ncbi:hypothetical protein [Neorhodopirellula lusitana]|uniref:hypothetical protein n=1 Tax=Neorhodopirellula lusitana TaxID=445327 RepID=UPI00385090BE